MTPVMVAVFSALPLLLLLIGLVLSVLTNTYIERAQKKVMLAFLVLVTLLVLQNAAEFILVNADSLHWALRIQLLYNFNQITFKVCCIRLNGLFKPKSFHYFIWISG